MNRSLPQPTTPDPADAPPLRWGVLAPGGIARTFAQSLAGTQQTIVAAGSRSLERATEFTDQFGGRPYGSYEELVGASEVDAVYVASPHSEHRDHALLAIAAGKPVLVEKAFTRNASEARQVVAAARNAEVFCLEAMWSRFLPHYDVIRSAVSAGLVGELRWIAADHGQALHPHGPRRLEDPSLAGGALLDLGIYPISFARMIDPKLELDYATGILTDKRVDMSVSVALRSSSTLAALAATMATQTPNTAVIAGTKGRLEIDGWFYFPTALRLVTNEGEVLDRYTASDDDHALRYEAAEVARCVHAGKLESHLMPLDETVSIMELLDEIRARLGVRFPGE